MTPTEQDKMSEEELQEDVFGGKSLRENLRDIIARNNTGYSYAELLEAVKSGEDLLEDDEVVGVDKTVNLLSHLITADRKRVALEARIDEVERELRRYGDVFNYPPQLLMRKVELKAQQEKV